MSLVPHDFQCESVEIPSSSPLVKMNVALDSQKTRRVVELPEALNAMVFGIESAFPSGVHGPADLQSQRKAVQGLNPKAQSRR